MGLKLVKVIIYLWPITVYDFKVDVSCYHIDYTDLFLVRLLYFKKIQRPTEVESFQYYMWVQDHRKSRTDIMFCYKWNLQDLRHIKKQRADYKAFKNKLWLTLALPDGLHHPAKTNNNSEWKQLSLFLFILISWLLLNFSHKQD